MGPVHGSFEEIVEEYLGWFRQVHPTVRFDRVMVTESVPGQTVGLEGVLPAEFAPRFEQLVEWIDSDWINLTALTVVEGGTLLLGVEYRGPQGKKRLSREQISVNFSGLTKSEVDRLGLEQA